MHHISLKVKSNTYVCNILLLKHNPGPCEFATLNHAFWRVLLQMSDTHTQVHWLLQWKSTFYCQGCMAVCIDYLCATVMVYSFFQSNITCTIIRRPMCLKLPSHKACVKYAGIVLSVMG